jgi:hypothetical protein
MYTNLLVDNSMLRSWISFDFEKPKTQIINSNDIIYKLLSSSIKENSLIVSRNSGLIVKKIKLNPNMEEKEKLLQWFGCYRFVFS